MIVTVSAREGARAVLPRKDSRTSPPSAVSQPNLRKGLNPSVCVPCCGMLGTEMSVYISRALVLGEFLTSVRTDEALVLVEFLNSVRTVLFKFLNFARTAVRRLRWVFHPYPSVGAGAGGALLQWLAWTQEVRPSTRTAVGVVSRIWYGPLHLG